MSILKLELMFRDQDNYKAYLDLYVEDVPENSPWIGYKGEYYGSMTDELAKALDFGSASELEDAYAHLCDADIAPEICNIEQVDEIPEGEHLSPYNIDELMEIFKKHA
jgi:hypothetical protein